jgi:ADP-ribose pyrophosphatase
VNRRTGSARESGRRETSQAWSSVLERTLHRNPFFGVLQHQVRLPDGSRTTYFTIDFPKPAVGVVAVQNGRFLMLRQYRFIVDEFVWAIPSGGIHRGETSRAAAARELLEETGYRARRLRRLQTSYASYGCGNQVFEIFIAEGLVRTRRHFDRNEVVGIRWFTPKELLGLIARNGIVDSLSLAPLLLVLLRRHARSMPRIMTRRLTPRVAKR